MLAATHGARYTIRGVPRMHERPIGPLVDAPEVCQTLRQVWQNDWGRSETFEAVSLKMLK